MRNTNTTLLFIAIIIIAPIHCIGQVLVPMPTKDQLSDKIIFYGSGSIELLKDIATDPTGRIMMFVHPLANLQGLLFINKGAGLESVEADSFNIQGLIFPEISNSSVWISVSSPFHLGGIERESWFQVEPFIDMAIQEHNIQQSSQEKKIAGLIFNPGLKILWNYIAGSNRFRVIAGLSYHWLEISEGSKAAYLSVFKNSQLPMNFRGIGIKLAAQVNDLTVGGSIRNIPTKYVVSDKDLSQTVKIGMLYRLEISFSGSVIGF